ncbi:MAG: hypothetical protein MMC33_010885 [Icmadophila ericetorum]|nr:hypothetical protein [Icmadophila ericetorum]
MEGPGSAGEEGEGTIRVATRIANSTKKPASAPQGFTGVTIDNDCVFDFEYRPRNQKDASNASLIDASNLLTRKKRKAGEAGEAVEGSSTAWMQAFIDGKINTMQTQMEEKIEGVKAVCKKKVEGLEQRVEKLNAELNGLRNTAAMGTSGRLTESKTVKERDPRVAVERIWPVKDVHFRASCRNPRPAISAQQETFAVLGACKIGETSHPKEHPDRQGGTPPKGIKGKGNLRTITNYVRGSRQARTRTSRVDQSHPQETKVLNLQLDRTSAMEVWRSEVLRTELETSTGVKVKKGPFWVQREDGLHNRHQTNEQRTATVRVRLPTREEADMLCSKGLTIGRKRHEIKMWHEAGPGTVCQRCCGIGHDISGRCDSTGVTAPVFNAQFVLRNMQPRIMHATSRTAKQQEEWPAPTNVKCANCGGKHHATAFNCPKRRRAESEYWQKRRQVNRAKNVFQGVHILTRKNPGSAADQQLVGELLGAAPQKPPQNTANGSSPPAEKAAPVLEDEEML